MAKAKDTMEALLDKVDWQPLPKPENIPEGELWATHSGVLTLPGRKDGEPIHFRVHQLSNGQRVINAEDLKKWGLA